MRRESVTREFYCKFTGELVEFIEGQAITETKFRSILEKRIRPCRSASITPLCIRCGGKVAAVN